MKQSRQNSAPPAAAQGFSLMELLLVLALLTVLAALTVPALHSWQQRLTLERAATALQHQITETRLRSIQSGERWVLVLSLPEKTSRQLRPDRPLYRPEILQLPKTISLKAEPEKGQPTTDAQMIRLMFRPDGTCSATSLLLNDTRGNTLSLSIDRLTGSVRITAPKPGKV